jgi:hypothetical protein
MASFVRLDELLELPFDDERSLFLNAIYGPARLRTR